MKELKSKKTGKVQICSEEEYAEIVNKKPEWLKRFEITDMKAMRPIIPSLKTEVPHEIKTKIKSK
jgi:hypothetical protein